MTARRGVSLIETVVVLFIGVVLLFSLLPTSIELLRQQKALNASVLSLETFPLLWERLGRDFSEAAGAMVDPPVESPEFLIFLTPLKPGNPAVTREFRYEKAARTTVRADEQGRETIVRTAVRTDEEGRETRSERTWTIEGRFSLMREALVSGRWVFRYERPPKGEEEILGFALGRPTRPQGAKPEKTP